MDIVGILISAFITTVLVCAMLIGFGMVPGLSTLKAMATS
jgi:hypothetical protein